MDLNREVKHLKNRVDAIEEKLTIKRKGKEGKPVSCEYCGYEWKCKSNAVRVSCPRCNKKTKI